MADQHPDAVIGRLVALDEAVFSAVASWEAPALDDTMPVLSEVANHSKLWMGTSLLLAAFGGTRGRRTAIEGMAAVGITSALANLVLKGLTRRTRPGSPVPEERRLEQPTSTSFPSGHTASAAAFSGVVGIRIPVLWAPINLLAAAVGFSRVYTGVHYPGDVVAGWAVGRVVAHLVLAVSRRRV